MKEKICTVTTIKASLQDTIAFVNYHLNIGIDHMFLFFDDPDDMAINALSKYKRVTSIKCNSQHWAKLNKTTDMSRWLERQDINATLGLKLARESGYIWIIHIDSDELIYSNQPLKKLLANVSQDIDFVKFLPLEAVPEKDEYEHIFNEVILFKNLPRRRQKYLAYLLGGKKTFLRGEYFRGHMIGKSATRLNNKDISVLRPHFPVAEDNKKLSSCILKDANILHFDGCGFDRWQAKWMIRYAVPTGFRMRQNRQEQFKMFAKQYEKGNIEKLNKLYNRMHCLSKFEKYILTKIGLLKEIHINKKLFERSPQINYLEPALK